MIYSNNKNQSFKTSTWISNLGIFYMIGVFGVSILAFYPGLLDYTLLPRYACASLIFWITTLNIYIKSTGNKSKIFWPQIDLSTVLLLSYFIWSTSSITWSTNFSEAIFESQKIIIPFAAFYYSRWFELNDKQFTERLLKTIVIISIPILILTSWQIFTLDKSLENPLYEITGISGHKNLFSTVLFLLGGFNGIAFFWLNNHWKKASALLLFISLIFILYLRTRSVYVGLITVSGVFMLKRLNQHWSPKLARFINILLISLIVTSIAAFLYLLQSKQLIPILDASKIDQLWQSQTGYERLNLWEKTACVIQETPFFGVGAGNWQIQYPNCSVHGLYSVEMDLTTFQRPHNDWLWVWAETGIIGLISYIGFFIAVLRKGMLNLKRYSAESNSLAALTRIAIIAGFMFIAFFSFPKERIEILLLVFSMMGLFYPKQISQNRLTSNFTKVILGIILISNSLNLFISLKRTQGEINAKKAIVLKQQQKWNELIPYTDKAYSAWYTIDPTSVPIHWYRGTANFVIGNQELALKDFLKAEEHAPFNHYIHNDLGSCYLKMGEREKSMTHYKEAIRISPLFDDPRVNIGLSYYKEGNYKIALEWINSIQNHKLKEKYRAFFVDEHDIYTQ